MATLMIADAHLQHPSHRDYKLLAELLERITGRIDNLVLLGDFFEFWFGYRHTVFANYVPILALLEKISRSSSIYAVEGNHDFHFGTYFQQQLGARLLPQGGSVQLENQWLHLAHGDLINPYDRGYRLLHWFLRSPLVYAVGRCLPPDLAWRIAMQASARSQAKRLRKQAPSLPETLFINHARQQWQQGHQWVFWGHFHHHWRHQEQQQQAVAVGPWQQQHCFAVLKQDQLWHGHYQAGGPLPQELQQLLGCSDS